MPADSPGLRSEQARDAFLMERAVTQAFVEAPRAVLPSRDHARLAGPGAGRGRGHDVAVALNRSGGRGTEVLVLDGALQQRVDGEQRFVMRDTDSG